MTTVEIQEDFKLDFLKELLYNEEVRDLCVVFTKKDGTQREMACTLAESRIPEDKRPKTTTADSSQEAVRVFDEGIQEWRSFRTDSISKFSWSDSTSSINYCFYVGN